MDPILKIRTISPNLPGGMIRRERLNKILEQNIDKNLVLISSPAGFGKTTLVRDFLSKNEYCAAWLIVSSDMNNLYTFVNYLIDSLKTVNKEFGKDTLQVIEFCRENYQLAKNSKTIINNIIGTFTNEFLNLFNDDVILVLDDLGNLGNHEWLIELMNALMENIPANLHIIVTTRVIPEINFSQLQAKRKVYKLDEERLVFTRNETAELLENVYHVSYTEDDIIALETNIGGWITGIHLILQTWGDNFAKLKLYNETVLEDIFDFFAEDIFRSIDKKIQKFLLDTALLEDFTPGTVNELLEITYSRSVLDDLQKKNIFLQAGPVLMEGAYEVKYNYQVLFRKFLISKFHQLRSGEERDSLLKRISGYYLLVKDYDKAVSYGLMTKDPEFVTGIILDNFQGFYDRGAHDILWKWISGLKEETIEKNAYLLYYKSILMKFYLGDTESSLKYVDKAIVLFEINGQDQSAYMAVISKARNLLNIGKVKEAFAILNQIREAETDPKNKAELLYLLAYSFYLNSGYEDSLPLLEEALTVCTENNVRKIQADIYNLFGNIYLIHGDYNKAFQYYDKVVKSSFGIDDKLETLCNLVLMHAQTGNFDKSWEFLEEAKELIGNISIPVFKIAFLLAKQSIYFEYGDYEGALAILEEMHNIALKIKHNFYIYLSRVLTADTYYYLNMLAKAEEYYGMAFSYIDDENKMEKSQYALMKALALKKEFAESHDSSSLKPVENVLIETYSFYGDSKLNYTKNHVSFHLADLYLKRGYGISAKQYLKECLKTAREKDYLSYLQREFMDSRQLFDFAIANNIEKEFVRSIVSSVLHKNGADWISQAFRKRLEGQLIGYYDVSIVTFNNLEFYVRGVPVPENEWRKKKWKLAALYLFLNSKQGVTKDKIIDVFYPDTPVESIDNIFHQLVSRLRTLLKIDSIFTEDPQDNLKDKTRAKKSAAGTSKKTENDLINSLSFLTYHDKVLKFNNDFNFEIDVDRFEKFYRLAKSEQERQKKIEYMKKAVYLYKGEFLAGIYEVWSEDIRNKIKGDFVSLSEELIKFLYDLKLYDEVIYYSENLLMYDKLNESAYLNSIKVFAEWERLNSAREKYSQMMKYYETELGEKPSAKVTKQIESLLNP